jgi:hypothetical protein
MNQIFSGDGPNAILLDITEFAQEFDAYCTAAMPKYTTE